MVFKGAESVRPQGELGRVEIYDRYGLFQTYVFIQRCFSFEVLVNYVLAKQLN